MIALQLPLEVETKLKEISQRMGRSENELAIEAILDFLDEIEDVQIAEARLEELRRGDVKTIPLAEVMARYGMES